MLWLNGLILVLVLAGAFALQIPAVQHFAARKATAYLAGKLNTGITIGRFTTDWRNSIVLKEIYLQDQNKDTLLYAGRLGLDLHIFGLRSNRLHIRSMKIEDATLQLRYRVADSSYNFDFIGQAVSGSSPKTDNSEAFSFKLSGLTLKNVRFQVNDPLKGNFGRGRIGHLTVLSESFDSQTKTWSLGNIRLENAMVSWRKTRVLSNKDKIGNPDLTFQKIRLRNIRVDFLDETAARRMHAKVGNAELRADKIALENARADLSHFTLQNAIFSFYKLKRTTENKSDSEPKPFVRNLRKTVQKNKDWAVWLKDAKWQNIRINYRDLNKPLRKNGIDFNYLLIRNFNLELSNVYYSQGRISGKMDQLQLQEKSGFRVATLQAELKAGSDFLTLTDFVLKTNYSLLRSGFALVWKPDPATSETKLTFTAHLKNATVGPKDILFFTPDLAGKPVFRKLGQQPLRVTGRVTGQHGDLYFKDFNLKGWAATQLFFNGKVKQVLDEEQRVSDLQVRKFNTTRADLITILGDGKTAPKFRFPDRISLSGNLQNRKDKLSFQNLKISTSYGDMLQASGAVTGPPGKKNVDLQVQNLLTSRTALLAMLPSGTVSPEVELPHALQFTGRFKGSSIQDFATKGTFKTSYGNLYADVKVQPIQQFSGHISLDDFNAGKLLKLENMLGPATGKADFKGKGFKVQTMDLHYKANVKKIVYKKDTYRNLRLEGDLNKKIYQLNGNLANAALQGLGHKLKKISPKNIDLKKADPTRLIPKKVQPKKLIPKVFRKKKKEEEKK